MSFKDLAVKEIERIGLPFIPSELLEIIPKIQLLMEIIPKCEVKALKLKDKQGNVKEYIALLFERPQKKDVKQ